MKYLVKNITSGEEVLCEKVVVGDFDYYLSNDNFNYPCFVITDIDKLVEVNKNNEEYYHRFNSKKIIATTNKSLDLPIVVDEVESLISDLGIDLDKASFSESDKFYSIGHYRLGYNKAKETYYYTKEDLINFKQQAPLILEQLCAATDEELFDIWQEQKTITISVK